MTSLLLTEDWDLTVNASGDMALASDALSLAQDAACAIRLFAGELYFDTAQGIPYFSEILGEWPPISLVKAYLNEAAKTVPGVRRSVVFLTGLGPDRVLSGQVQVTNKDNVITGFNF